MSSHFDIIIVGGGMVGLTMAASLVESRLKILLVEKHDFLQQFDDELLLNKAIKTKEFELRVSAISPANRNFLMRLNVWQKLPESRQANYQKMKVWDGDGSGEIEFSAAQLARPDLGVIVENRLLQAALLKKIQSYGNVTCRFGLAIEKLEQADQQISIHLADGSQYESQLLIGADGANSVVREKLMIPSCQLAYQQTAFVSNVKTELTHQQTAWQRFTKHGPIAFLPLPPENLCSVVWSLDNEKANQLKGISQQQFAQKLQYAFESKLGKVTALSQPLAFPLTKRHAQNYLSHRAAIIGDAAHTIHPLAGQGVNLGFQDVECLSQLIIKLHQQKRDLGLKQNLRPFERERKTHNLIMQNLMSGFKHLFSNQSLAITLIRNIAMSGLNQLPIAKEIMIKKAMGF